MPFLLPSQRHQYTEVYISIGKYTPYLRVIPLMISWYIARKVAERKLTPYGTVLSTIAPVESSLADYVHCVRRSSVPENSLVLHGRTIGSVDLIAGQRVESVQMGILHSLYLVKCNTCTGQLTFIRTHRARAQMFTRMRNAGAFWSTGWMSFTDATANDTKQQRRIMA